MLKPIRIQSLVKIDKKIKEKITIKWNYYDENLAGHETLGSENSGQVGPIAKNFWICVNNKSMIV